MGVVRALLVPPCPPDSDFFDFRPGGTFCHPRKELEALWTRIWNRWHDQMMCQNWWDFRSHHSLEAWIYGFTETSIKERELATEGVKLQRPFAYAKNKAQHYDANPELCKKLMERRKQQKACKAANVPPPPVKLTDEQRDFWRRQYARKAGQVA